MSFPTESVLQFLRDGSANVATEFEHLYAQLAGWLGVEHAGDGSHTDITADSLTLGDGSTIDTFSEGVFTAGVRFNFNTTGITYGTRTCSYQVLNGICTALFDITLTSKGSDTGTATLSLPVPATADGVVSIGYFATMNTITSLFGYVEAGTRYAVFQTGAAGGSTTISDTAFQNATRIIGVAIYPV